MVCVKNVNAPVNTMKFCYSNKGVKSSNVDRKRLEANQLQSGVSKKTRFFSHTSSDVSEIGCTEKVWACDVWDASFRI